MLKKGYEETDFKLRHNCMMGYFSDRNVGIVKEERDQTTSRFSIRFTQFSKQDVKSMTYCSSGSLTAAKFILMSILQNKSKLNNSVKNNKNITNNIILLFSYSSFRCLPLQKVYLLLFPNLLFYLLFLAGCFLITCLLRLED